MPTVIPAFDPQPGPAYGQPEAQGWTDAARKADVQADTADSEASAAVDRITAQVRTLTDKTVSDCNVFYELGRQHQAELDKVRAEGEANLARAYAEHRIPVKNPPGIAGEGFLYVIAFTTGTVKVGQTEDPRQRLNTHQAEAAAFGVGANAYWISPSHSNFKTNETLLIEQCRKVSRRSRREYYHEIGYERAVQFALDLHYESQITNPVCVEMDRR